MVELIANQQGDTEVFQWVGSEAVFALPNNASVKVAPVITGLHSEGKADRRINENLLLSDYLVKTPCADTSSLSLKKKIECKMTTAAQAALNIGKAAEEQNVRSDIFTNPKSTNPTHSEMNKDHAQVRFKLLLIP